jgi:hypothetical protein
VDAVHRTRIHAGRVLGADAGFRNYIRHVVLVPPKENCSRTLRPFETLVL